MPTWAGAPHFCGGAEQMRPAARRRPSSASQLWGAPDLGQFVGAVQDVIECRHVHYVHVRGGLEHSNELCVRLAAVRAVVGKQVHLN